jgi:hypothetical protein
MMSCSRVVLYGSINIRAEAITIAVVLENEMMPRLPVVVTNIVVVNAELVAGCLEVGAAVGAAVGGGGVGEHSGKAAIWT